MHGISHAGAKTTYTRDVPREHRRSAEPPGPAMVAPRPTSTTSNFTGRRWTRTDPTVDFVWGASGRPRQASRRTSFSVRWTGQVEAPSTGTYTFYTVSNDGVRLWVNGQQIINNWSDPLLPKRTAELSR